MDVIEGNIGSTIESLRNYLAIDNLHTDEDDSPPKVIAVYNVEKVAVNELKRLDFLFALAERSFGHTNTVVILLWNTDDRPLDVEEAELHTDDSGDIDINSLEDEQMFSLRDFLSKEWSKSGSLVNGDALAGRLAGTAYCPACSTSSGSDQGAVSSPLAACLSNKKEVDRILLDKEKMRKALSDVKTRKRILVAVLVLIVTCSLLSYLLPNLKAVDVVNIQKQPMPVPLPPPLADLKTSKTKQNAATIEAEGVVSRVEGTEESAPCDPLGESEPAGDDAEPSASEGDASTDSAEEVDSLVPESIKELSQSVQEVLPTPPRYHTRSRFKD
jgi:hypothetical protein